MYLDQLRQLAPQISDLADRYGARRVRVFGSVARGEDTPQSDLDVLVDFPRGYDLLAQRMPLALGLSDLLGRQVDLVPEHELSPYLRAQVLAEAVDL